MADSPTRGELAQRLEAALAEERFVTQVTRLSPPGAGARLLLFADGERAGTLGDPALDRAATREATTLMSEARGKVARSTTVDEVRLFIELFPPPPHLLIFGGVHVAVPLADFAKQLGFRVTLADPRSTFANAERFPTVDRIIPEWPQAAVEQLVIGPSIYVAILTHDPKLDEPALEAVLGRGAAYVGAIGSRGTHRDRFDRMARHGVTPEQLEEVYAPIGLDLNAESPEEIALAIMAEIVAVRRGGRAGFMRDG